MNFFDGFKFLDKFAMEAKGHAQLAFSDKE